MAQAGKTFRVFVSSTFSDLKAERNALQQLVFPRLRELCMQHGCRFQAIDLRWGVSEEAALDQQTMKICLKEIARCQEVTPRPNFIVLLGDRYGWRPLPAEIPADEFAAIKRQITSDADLTLLERLYRLDENALYRRAPEDVPVGLYCLQRRRVNDRVAATDQEREATREAEAAEWRQVESHLRRILLGAVASLDLRDGELAKYHASATEQEIMQGAMNVTDAAHHVSCFFRSLRSANERPLAEVLPSDDAIQDFIDLDDDGSFDNDAAAKLRDLQARLRKHLATSVHEYDARWLGSGVDVSQSPITLDHIGTLPQDLDECLKLVEDEQAPSLLCADVWRRLAWAILQEIAEIERVSAVQREKEEHEKFGAKRAKHFRGRARYLDAIQQYVDAKDQHPFALWGESGSGKSALLARAAERIRETNLNAELVVRFIGATPQSSDVRALLESLCHEISGLYEVEQDTIPGDYNGLIKDLLKRLALATEQKPLVIMLDALDQLSDAEHGRSLIWLPIRLPENVRVIVSTIPGECLTTLQRKLPAEGIFCLEAMPESEGGEVLELWLQDAGRTLQDDQRLELLNKFAVNGLPLYLKLAFEEARLWHSYDSVHPLAADVPGIISDLFERLSDEANHGAVMVSRSLGYLAASRNGLTEDEILAVLSSDKEVMSEFKRRSVKSPEVNALPVVVWSRLFFDLEPYLSERSADNTSLLSFYHRQLGEVTAQKYLSAEDKQRAHKHLADYFDSQDYWLETPQQYRDRAGAFPTPARRANLRKAVEFPWQLRQAEDSDRLEQIHTNLEFLESKTAAGLVFELAQDFTEAIKRIPSKRPLWRIVRLLGEALLRDIHFIALQREDYPQALFQCLWNSCWWYDCPEAARHYETSEGPWSGPGPKLHELLDEWRAVREEKYSGFYWVRSLRPPSTHLGTALCAVLRAHGLEVSSVAISSDGRRVVSGSYDKTVRVWDGESGEELRCVRGHRREVSSVAISSDGRRIVSGSWDRTVRVWDGESGVEMLCLRGHEGAVRGVGCSSDGRRIVSVSDDDAVRVWDGESGEELHCLRGHEGRPVRVVAISSDGRRIISGSGDNTVRVWDGESGKELRCLRGHEGWVHSVAISSDSRRIVSGSEDMTARVWDVESGQELRCLRGHENRVVSVAISSDGRRLVTGSRKSGSGDIIVRVWDGESGEGVLCLRGHEDWVRCVAISSDGRRIVGGSGDNTVRVWDGESGEDLRCLRGHDGRVNSVAISSEGGRIVSGSGEFGSNDNTVRVWDVESGLELHCLRGHENRVLSVAISSEGGRIVSGSYDDTVRVWDGESGKELRCLCGHKGTVYSVAISGDRRRIVSGSWDHTVRVWDVESGKELCCLLGHEGTVNIVAISSDGRRTVSGSWDHTVRVWDVESGEELRRLRGHEDSVAISTDGRRIVSGSWDKRVRVWDTESGECLEVIEGSGDAHLLAEGVTAFPFRALTRGAETLIEDTAGRLMALFPVALDSVTTHPSGRLWAGASGNHVHVIALEGMPDQTPT